MSQRISKIGQTARIEVFTSPTCPHCPHAKKIVADIADERDDVKYTEYSTATSKGSRKAKVYGVRSVPTLMITGPGTEERIGYVGTPSEKQLNRMVDIALGQADWPQKQSIVEKIMNKLTR